MAACAGPVLPASGEGKGVGEQLIARPWDPGAVDLE